MGEELSVPPVCGEMDGRVALRFAPLPGHDED
jgi:hypothetical protein